MFVSFKESSIFISHNAELKTVKCFLISIYCHEDFYSQQTWLTSFIWVQCGLCTSIRGHSGWIHNAYNPVIGGLSNQYWKY